MTIGIDESKRTTLASDDAFGLLGEETRMAIIQVLGEVNEPLSFSELRDRVGMSDSGQFNYHLDKLEGHFIRQTGAGYVLEQAGKRVVRAVLSGTVTEVPRELEQYEPLIETVSDGVYALDENLRFSFVNDALCEMLEMPREEILGTPATDLFAAEEEVSMAEEIREQVVKGDTSVGTIQRTLPTSDGERILEARYRFHPEPDGEYRGSVGIVRDVTERKEREEELRRQRTLVQDLLNAIPDVVFAYDEAGEHIVEDALLDEFAGYPNEELARMELVDFLPEEDRAAVEESCRRALEEGETVTFETEIVTKDGRPIPHEFRAAPMELEGKVLGVAATARDITKRLKRERKLERQRDELATLDRINDLLLETARELIQASSRDAVERAICERIAASDLYQFAWVGERELAGDRIVPRATAGDDHGYLDAVTITADESATGQSPAGRAMRTGEIQVVSVDDSSFERWPEPTKERGFESIAAVPLRHGETVYGVLVIYATRGDAFSEREQAGFDVLGRTVGFVIHAARSRELLFADAVVELEFDIPGDIRFVRTATAFDCELALDGYIVSDERWIQYLTITGASPEAVAEAMAADPQVDRAQVVSEGCDGGRIGLVTAVSSLWHTVTAAGATIRTVEANVDGARIVIEAPVDADIHDIVDHIRNEYPGSDLVARREHDREITMVGRPEGLLDELTDRQREALETAYRSGYFAWPRESTAEEVAESLDLTSATLHGHLRKAEEVILSTLLDGE